MRIIVGTFVWCLLLSSCGRKSELCRDGCIAQPYFSTADSRDANIDSVALWHGPEGQYWLVATAKSAHTLPVYDAITGALVKRIGSIGFGPQQLLRPNGIAIQDDFLFVVERDNKRLQVLHLPDGAAIGLIADPMDRPYGIATLTTIPGERYVVYVTDNGDRYPVKKIHQYDAHYVNGQMQLTLIRTFGDDNGIGALWKVESIVADKAFNRLLVADEHAQRRNIKIYTLDGQFTGRTIGDGILLHEPEGIALYETAEDNGYIIVTDQDKQDNRFLLFDRSSLVPLTYFIGDATRNTDGITITNERFGPFSSGAFYAVNDDNNIQAYDWHTLAVLCGLEEKRN